MSRSPRPAGPTRSGVYSYAAAPTVTGVSPNAGPVAGNTSVTITGTDLTGATAVTFGGTAATIGTVTATTITATTPAHAMSTVDITVTTPGGTSATSASDQFNYRPAPTVTSVSPNTGPIAGGTSVTITGTNLTGATAVTFGGTAATIGTVTATTITATTPAHAAGVVDVVVTTPGGPGTGISAYIYPAATTTAIVSNDNPSTFHDNVTFTATISSASGGVPTGLMTFKDDTTPLNSVLLRGGNVIAGGGRHFCAITDAGGAKCWGRPGNGQVGDVTNAGRHVPTVMCLASAAASSR